MIRTRGMMLAAALLAAPACKTSSGAAQATTPQASGSSADSATRDGQRVAVEGNPQAGEPGALPGTSQPGQLAGRVAIVDARNLEIAVDSGQATQQVKVSPSADITVDGKKASFSDLKQGQEVRVSLAQGADGPAANKIEVTHTKK